MTKLTLNNCSPNERIDSFIEVNRAFPRTDFTGPLFNDHRIVERNDSVVGFGCLKLTSEAILVLSHFSSDIERAKALKLLLQEAIHTGQQHGLDEIHAFLTGPFSRDFATILREHFGFESIQGIPLVLRLK